MATNDPLVPSMIFRSRTTKASSKVTEQKAWRRSLLSSMSLIRTSVMTTAVLLFYLWHRPGGPLVLEGGDDPTRGAGNFPPLRATANQVNVPSALLRDSVA